LRRTCIAGLVLFCLLAWGSDCSSRDSIDWMTDYLTGLERARIERKPVMIDFYTSWCYYCKVLDARTYTEQGVIELSGQMVSLKINAEKERRLAAGYFIRAYPIIVFLSREGKEIKRLYGYQTPAALKSVMKSILEDTSRLEALAAKYKKAPEDQENAYLYADELMARGRFDGAENVLEKLVRKKGSPRYEDATLDLGICHFRSGDHKEAAKQISKFLSSHKDSRRADEAKLFYGLSLLATGEKQKGVGELRGLEKKAYRSWVSEEAQRQLALAGAVAE
jgi:thioredoxin-like negative regulator of GroEL